MLMPGGLPGGAWAQLELTDALRNVEINSRQIIFAQNYDSALTACPGKSTKVAIACINRF